ncbi:MAG: hypothetical protein WCG91_03550 [Candidatus Shapirobacteria bacterium]
MTILNLFQPHPVLAQTKDWSQIASTKACSINEVATIQGIECMFYNILQVVVFFAGIAFFCMFIYGGFQYLFSSNDPKKTAVASSTLTMAIVGLVGVIGSWLIMSLIKNFTGIDVTNFKIPG